MARRIVTIQLQAAGAGGLVDGYFDRLLKYIPADVVGAWVAASGIVASADGIPKDRILWISFGVGLAFTAIWTWKQTTFPSLRPAVTQISVASIAFVVWVFALGGPFANLPWYKPVYGSLVLIAYTLLVALIVPSEK